MTRNKRYKLTTHQLERLIDQEKTLPPDIIETVKAALKISNKPIEELTSGQASVYSKRLDVARRQLKYATRDDSEDSLIIQELEDSLLRFQKKIKYWRKYGKFT